MTAVATAVKDSPNRRGGLMKTLFWTGAVGLAAVAALIAVPAAMAAYTSAKLEVRWTANSVNIKATGDPADDPTASVRIFAPAGTQLTTNQAPGTTIGRITAIARALDLAGAEVPLSGPIVVASPGQVSPTDQAACLQGATPLATWVLMLSAAGQSLPVPAFLVPTTAAQAPLGPAYIQVCLRPPDVPVGTPGRQPLGAKAYSVDATLNGVFSQVPVGAWIALWTPYTPLVGAVNVAGTVASPAAIAPGALSLTARTAGRGALVSGAVTQAGQPRGGATVTILGGTARNRLTTRKRVRVSANGRFSTRFAVGTFFRATAVATGGVAMPLCTQLAAALAPIPCVNPTVNGFTAQSKVVRKK
jgi:hypothetical protein